jgi:hypothetical protein
MRVALFLLLCGLTAAAQEPPPQAIKEAEPRYGIPVKLKIYPQATAKQALESVIEACEKDDFGYLVAHLLDPAFVDQRVADRARPLEAAIEVELTKLRDFQYANPDRVDFANRLPLDRNQFLAVVIEKSRERGGRLFTRDVETKLRDDPQALKDLKKILRDGTFTDEPGGAKAVHPMVKDKAVYFKKIGERWFVENRQAEETKKETKE